MTSNAGTHLVNSMKLEVYVQQKNCTSEVPSLHPSPPPKVLSNHVLFCHNLLWQYSEWNNFFTHLVSFFVFFLMFPFGFWKGCVFFITIFVIFCRDFWNKNPQKKDFIKFRLQLHSGSSFSATAFLNIFFWTWVSVRKAFHKISQRTTSIYFTNYLTSNHGSRLSLLSPFA